MLARKSLLHFLNTVVGAVLGMLALKLVALYLGDVLLGQVAYAMGLTGLLQGLMHFGLPSAHRKKLAEGEDEDDRLATFVYTELGLQTLFLVGVGGFLVYRVFVEGRQFYSTTLLTIVVVALHLAFNALLGKVTVQTFNARQEVATGQSLTFLHDVIRIGSTITLAVVYAAVAKNTGPLAGMLGPGFGWVEVWGAELLAGTYLAASVVASVIGLALMKRRCPFGSFDVDILRDYWSFGRPVWLVSVVGVFANQLDRALLGFFWGGSQTGIYFAMDRVISVVNSIGPAVGSILMPAISFMASEGDEQAVADVAFRAHRYITMVVLPMVLGLSFYAEPFIEIVLSNRFLLHNGALVLAALGGYALVSSTMRPYRDLILGMDRPQRAAAIGFTMLGTNAILNVVFIPANIRSLGIELLGLGAFGAALATFISGVVGYAVARYLAGDIVSVRAQWPVFGRQLVAGGVMIGGLILVGQLVGEVTRWFHLVAVAPLGLGIYLVALYVVGGFTVEDYEFFADALHPRKMLEYVHEELLGEEE